MKAKRTKRKHGRLRATDELTCSCGCGAEVQPRRRFKQGHDARMRSNSAWRKQHPELGH